MDIYLLTLMFLSYILNLDEVTAALPFYLRRLSLTVGVDLVDLAINSWL